MTQQSQKNNRTLQIAHEKIENVLLRLYRSDTLMLRALCIVDKIPDFRQETIGIDVRSNPPSLKYNPEFINVLSDRQLELVLASEGFKILLRHCTTRLRKPQFISALASQITVDHFIVSSEFMTDELHKYFPTADQFNMSRNLWFEEYFKELQKNANNIFEKLNVLFDYSNDNNSDNRSEGGYKKYNDANDALKEYFNPNGTNTKDWSENNRFDVEVEHVISKQSSCSYGKYTGNAHDQIVSAIKAKISWKDIFYRFARSVETLQTIPSRMKLNRRYELTSPGYRRQYTTQVVFAIDCSGSMSKEDLAEGFAVVNSGCRNAKIHYILFDTEILQKETLVSKAKRNFKIVGRGGTNFQCVIDYANKMKADGLIIYTDGVAPVPTKPKYTKKILWLMAKKELNPPVTWGYVAHLNRYETHN